MVTFTEKSIKGKLNFLYNETKARGKLLRIVCGISMLLISKDSVYSILGFFLTKCSCYQDNNIFIYSQYLLCGIIRSTLRLAILTDIMIDTFSFLSFLGVYFDNSICLVFLDLKTYLLTNLRG